MLFEYSISVHVEEVKHNQLIMRSADRVRICVEEAFWRNPEISCQSNVYLFTCCAAPGTPPDPN